MRIPTDKIPSFENCEIISVTQQLNVGNGTTQKQVKQNIFLSILHRALEGRRKVI